MTLVEKLEQKARFYDWQVKRSLVDDSYDQVGADMRDLLEAAAERLRELETNYQMLSGHADAVQYGRR